MKRNNMQHFAPLSYQSKTCPFQNSLASQADIAIPLRMLWRGSIFFYQMPTCHLRGLFGGLEGATAPVPSMRRRRHRRCRARSDDAPGRSAKWEIPSRPKMRIFWGSWGRRNRFVLLLPHVQVDSQDMFVRRTILRWRSRQNMNLSN